jgi:predicted metalloendopeptidase
MIKTSLAFENRINNLSWMSAETKVSALAKLNKQNKIGYPDKWKDYSALTSKVRKKEEPNALSMAKWRFEENIAELNKPVDKERWGMSPNGKCILQPIKQ